jgi:tetratricopeptide (TPR) repeat protein
MEELPTTEVAMPTKSPPPINRPKLMKRASAARAKGKHKKAIVLYGRVLEHEPDNPDLHKKLAPLYAKTKQRPEALASYQVAAEGLIRTGFDDRAIGLLRGAAAQLPTEAILWSSIAELELHRGRRADAVAVLVEGRSNLRTRRQRPMALQLLIKAHKIDPTDAHVSFGLACLLGRTGRRAMAMRLLEDLAQRPGPRKLVRIRRQQLRISPGIRTLGRFIRALILRR